MSAEDELGFVEINPTTDIVSMPVEDVDSLYLNEKYADVTFIVGGERLHAHKAILAVKSKGFQSLFKKNSEKKEIPILKTSPESFRLFLKYIYTDNITIPSDTKLMLEVLILARQYSFETLAASVVGKINTILDTENVCFFLNGANNDDLGELRDACLSFIDSNAMQILTSVSFNKLTQKSMVQLVKRDSFLAPEIEIFKTIAKWCEENKKDLDLECVPLSSLNVHEIVSVVWPTKLVSSQKLLEIISEIVNSKNSLPVAVYSMDENVATVQHKTKVITQVDTAGLLDGNKDAHKHVQHRIHDKNCIIIRLSRTYFINHIRMMLYDLDGRYYSYYIETSVDQKEWQRVVDYSKYACRSVQNLYFDQQVCQYIKIVGTSNSNGNDFHLVFFEAFCKRTVPKTINAVVCPEKNVATLENKAIVIEGGNPELLLSGNQDSVSCSYHTFGLTGIGGSSNCLIIQLAQPYVVSTMRLLLYDGENYSYKYLIETSVNKTDWEIAVDRRNEECKFWQDLRFTERVVVFIKIKGTYCSKLDWFGCVQLQCPSECQK